MYISAVFLPTGDNQIFSQLSLTTIFIGSFYFPIMPNFEEIVERQDTIETRLFQKMHDFENLIKSNLPNDNLENLHKEFSTFRNYVQDIFNLLRQQISEAKELVDVIEMRHRRKFLLLSGMEEKPDEDVKVIISNVLQQNLMLSSSLQISVAYRLGRKSNEQNRPILFRLEDHNMRALVWKKKSLLKGSSLVLREFLTRQRKSLFLEARRYFQMKNVWTNNGIIHIMLPCGKIERITCSDDLKKLISSEGLAKQDFTFIDKPVHMQLTCQNSSMLPSTQVGQPSSSKQGQPVQSRPKRTNKNK